MRAGGRSYEIDWKAEKLLGEMLGDTTFVHPISNLEKWIGKKYNEGTVVWLTMPSDRHKEIAKQVFPETEPIYLLMDLK
jgi:hypothetical protein